MPTPYTAMRLTNVKDSAKEFGVGEDMEVRFAKDELDAERTGVSHHRIKPGKRQPFAHQHDEAEEIYVVLGGSGRFKLDDEVIDVEPLDAIRVAPGVIRCFEAGPGGIEVLVVGARHDGDGRIIPGWWSD
ncbi:MAG TPA: cupin domain-containing protein [Solirubrobacterales bacterium]|nr:cupin domain-containing protein [Solirubrobacterales bacterium]